MNEGKIPRKRLPIVWPTRRVTFTFEHVKVGDDRFAPMIAQAMIEYIRDDPRGEMNTYTATNGVKITIESEKE